MIELRERAKFQFTRAISDVIETIARSGERLKVDRCTMGLVNLDVALSAYKTESQWRHEVLSNIDTNKEAEATYSKVALPAFLPNSNALYVVPNYLSRPNFITSRVVTGPAVVLSASTLPSHKKLSGAVVLIDSADPGYDWIFTHNILALVTQYGGVASHMAIRCAEFGIPGAIGCGPKLFERLCSAARIYLDCAREDIGIA